MLITQEIVEFYKCSHSLLGPCCINHLWNYSAGESDVRIDEDIFFLSGKENIADYFGKLSLYFFIDIGGVNKEVHLLGKVFV